ncbi:hypothetical protein A5791_17380 [Mycobacterium sp. 852002-51163_SCH5372311]|uniref:DUF4328 domain-containing protein n=1 Tax=Mycobacterium sp. 852002-51163_SCH5372311 TaxID=1834097 RepID=UPI0007FC2D56|nr:DUF4328 domain-containing protein [Mycobacterium sp. 852002-51163_SCH5372311]OBF88445.1 hypothetical protein A5791_17380 [Mycobacterium sp. 852002-51163_SCH5372311]
MIQVCSQCGTRWNVREKRREWCPRCRGALMAPLPNAPGADPRWSTSAGQSTAAAPAATRPGATASRPGGWQRTPPRLLPGFRWIAVRPGAAPPARRVRRPLGPTPHYAVIPRWGLADRPQVGEQAAAPADGPAAQGPSAATVRTTLFLGVLVLGIVALLYVVRYVVLIVNRSVLLNSLVALAVDWLGIVASVAAIATAILCAVTLIRWLIARRAAAFKHHGLPDQRSARALWAGCLIPLVNLFWAPVYVIELATVEDHYHRLQRPIVQWWIVWVISNVVSIFAIFTSLATDAQGIANNTAWMVFAYLFAAAAVAAVARVFEGFELKPIERPAHRWVVVGSDGPARSADRSAAPVEMDGQEPAA